MNQVEKLESCLVGLILGTAVGDALGLPAEGLSPTQIKRRWKGLWRMRLAFGRGMVSDDTEHAFLVGQSLLVANNDVTVFRRELAARLRWLWQKLRHGWLASKIHRFISWKGCRPADRAMSGSTSVHASTRPSTRTSRSRIFPNHLDWHEE
ncbi:MAG TPA: ADP-ribosylglycohydrolase family protein [Candidatus Paceibacterota bacterium]|nr:ADP-ribosylglycohydrolase family protein [Verrucomicrobiota bacterium]HRY51545.1 ADP-ribosylglycohydrolase family protein [Candidatus Paceibacterota bacterium]HRZ99662.1 ADP-ribosylglycohydrolase family protein [Candidatus Paceibacterota bacterium]